MRRNGNSWPSGSKRRMERPHRIVAAFKSKLGHQILVNPLHYPSSAANLAPNCGVWEFTEGYC